MIFKNISIIGDGGMASVMAMLLCEKGIKTRIWGYNSKQLAEIERSQENKKFLPGYKMPNNLEYQSDDSKIMIEADLVVSAVPCQFIRSVWRRLKSHTPYNIPIISVTKGVENKTLLRPVQILEEVLSSEGQKQFVVLSGPTIADELARKLPATACVAALDEKLAKKVQNTLNVSWFRIYTNTDIIGVELAGAMKNIIAIAAGIIDGIKAGDNAKAALLTRGLAEITRLGVACGAKPETFAGLTGLGDLMTTCISPKGRNRSLGERIGKGLNLQQAQEATESVVEGVATCKSVVALARLHKVDMPITKAVYNVLFRDKPVHKAIVDLMNRRLKAE
jgi:glycerol-3-phosphate dehydrogenase (NAD(P)+)